MATKKQIDYINEYKRKNLKRICFEVKKDYFDEYLAPAASAAGEPVNTYIKNAISIRMHIDGFGPHL